MDVKNEGLMEGVWRKGVSKHRVYEVRAASKDTFREVLRRFLGFRGSQFS